MRPTCSVHDAENEAVVAAALREHAAERAAAEGGEAAAEGGKGGAPAPWRLARCLPEARVRDATSDFVRTYALRTQEDLQRDDELELERFERLTLHGL